uniref:Uncharacterized protein n=1 Tax=Candidatus Kentrum sp. DK TaxID=2126562 RepID=A0A450SEY7_9GAMM|nr:MAG: hypothetical protein BECKDK2373C_GA0170839_103152 [Candidatus Kentron sp. DK]
MSGVGGWPMQGVILIDLDVIKHCGVFSLVSLIPWSLPAQRAGTQVLISNMRHPRAAPNSNPPPSVTVTELLTGPLRDDKTRVTASRAPIPARYQSVPG